MSLLESLFRHRLLVLTGKGGTGRTTLASSLGLAAARRGLRTVILETQGAQQVPPLFGRTSGGYTLQSLAPRLETRSLSPEACVEDFVVRQVRLRALYRAVFRNRVMAPFMEAVPGLPDVIQLGKVWDMAMEEESGHPRFDLLILDAPATGHGLTMLSSPQSMADLTMAGPLHANAARVRDLFADPQRTALVLTCLPETLPVRETLDLFARLGPFREQVAACLLNRTLRRPLPPSVDWQASRAHLVEASSSADVQALPWMDAWVRGWTAQEEALEALQARLPCPVATVPLLPTARPTSTQLSSLEAHLDEVALPIPRVRP